MARPRVPERLLSVSEIALLTGESRNTVRLRFSHGNAWHAKGLLIGGNYKLPTSAYNAWLEEHRLVPREEAQAA